MGKSVEIENIEELRRRQGIEDIELRQEIRGLGVGDFVRLTFLTGGGESSGETLLVRITSIRGYAFRGKLAGKPSAPALASLHVGSPLMFTTSHIHSLQKGEASHVN